jgi:hypothetical protein
MIEIIFTLDYEIYGDATGSLRELILEPAQSLMGLFQKWNCPLVVFVEVAELERIYQERSDQDIEAVFQQIRELESQGHEIALHLHPQWSGAKYQNGRWQVDLSEYNLCSLPEERIREIVSGGIKFLRFILGENDYMSISFRAGNWLFQPTQPAARILYEYGIRIDSSVFKGGRFKSYGVDYRKAGRNGCFWRFWDDVAEDDPQGQMLEIPIYTTLVPFWEMLSRKRLEIEKKGQEEVKKTGLFSKLKNHLSLKYPKKLDFCRLTKTEIDKMLKKIVALDQESPSILKPIAAIGHTKDLKDIDAVDYFLKNLNESGLKVTTFRSIYGKLIGD